MVLNSEYSFKPTLVDHFISHKIALSFSILLLAKKSRKTKPRGKIDTTVSTVTVKMTTNVSLFEAEPEISTNAPENYSGKIRNKLFSSIFQNDMELNCSKLAATTAQSQTMDIFVTDAEVYQTFPIYQDISNSTSYDNLSGQFFTLNFLTILKYSNLSELFKVQK